MTSAENFAPPEKTDEPLAGADIYRAGLGRRLPCGFIRVGPLATIPAILSDFGLDAAALMSEIGLGPDLFEHPDNAIPFKLACSLIARCADKTGRDDFGLLIGERTNASALGLVGFLLQQAEDVRSSLSDLVRYLHHHDRGASPFMDVKAGVVTLGYQIYEAEGPGCPQIYDGAIMIGCNIMRALCGPKFALVRVTLSRSKPSSSARYERLFEAPVCFGAERSALIFEERWLACRLPTPDAALRRMLQEQIDLIEAEEAGDFSEQVRRLLRSLILRQRAGVEDVCDLLRVTRRTLTRRLAAERTSYQQISDEIMFEIARQLLTQPDHSITDVALALRYSEASAFSRAFRQWSGVAPRAWRAQRLSQP